MKRVLISGIIAALAIASLGCSSVAPSPDPEAHTGYVEKKNLTHEKVHKIIVKAATENGWKMTEFKNNALVAEKITKDGSESTTVTFDRHSFDIAPANSELEGILEDALK